MNSGHLSSIIHHPSSIHGTGIGLRHCHFKEVIENKPEIHWFEVHTENFFSTGSAASISLEKIRRDYPLSAHSVGLSLGSYEEVSKKHLSGVKSFIERFEPSLVSDHLSWSAAGGVHVPDLLPIPYTEEALSAICRNIDKTQEFLGREILIENPSSYLRFKNSEMAEWEFLVAAAKRSGCGILLDVNNIYVSAHNHGFDADMYLEYIPAELVGEIHLAGYTIKEIDGKEVYIDTHGARIFPGVWDLYGQAIKKFSHAPTLIEWDTDVPELSVLIDEKNQAERIINSLILEAA